MALPDPGAVLAALAREREKFPPVVTNDQCGAILNATALQFPDMGMHRKPASDNTARLPNGVTVNRNVLRYFPPGDPLGWWSDVLTAAGAGIATPHPPSWARSIDGAESFVRPVPVAAPAPAPPPTPTPDPPPSADLAARVKTLEQWRQTLRAVDLS